MDSKKERRLADLEQQEARWRQAWREFKCQHCGAVLGTPEFELPSPGNGFKPPIPKVLSVRGGGIPLPEHDTPFMREMTERSVADLASHERSFTNLKYGPMTVEIEVGVQCRKCGTEWKDVPLAPPFRYASELARLRRQKWHEQSACIEAPGHVSS